MSRRGKKRDKRVPRPAAVNTARSVQPADTRRPRRFARAAAEAEKQDPAGGVSKRDKVLWGAVLLLIYASVASWGHFDFREMMGYYSMFADAVLQGRLYLDYTPDQVNLVDMIPYQGRYYLQWGPTPVIFHVAAKLVGTNLSDRLACLLVGWLTALVFLEIMLTLRARHFPELPKWLCAWFFFAFALGTPAALVTCRGTVYNESIGFGALCVLLGFLALLRYQRSFAAHWALLGGAAVTFALTTRVTLALYAATFFAAIAMVQWLRNRAIKPALPHLVLFALPVVLGGLSMLAYNHARFGSPWDYGNKYKPGASSHFAAFSVDRVPENFRHYVLSLPQLSGDFPWVDHVGWPPLVHTSRAEAVSSLLLGSPFLLLAGFSWRVFRRPSGGTANSSPDLQLATAVAAASGLLLFLVLLLFSAASRRYLHDFLPMFMIVSFAGAGTIPREHWNLRRWKSAAWAVLLFSALLHAQLAFYQSFHTPTPDLNVMRTFVAVAPAIRRIAPGPRLAEEEAIARSDLGTVDLQEGRPLEALEQYRQARELMPDSERIQQNLRLAERLAKQAQQARP